MSSDFSILSDNDDLPIGWEIACIKDLCEFNPKHNREISDDLEISFVPMSSVDGINGRIQTHEVKRLGELRKGYTHFTDGDVIFAKISPCMENGKVAVAKDLVNSIACGSTEFHVLRSQGAVLPEYLYRFLRQERYLYNAAHNMTGVVGQRRLPKDFLLDTEFRIPPLNEQRRIVEKVEALMVRSRRAKEALDAIPKLIEQFRQSVLAAAFRGDLTADWREQNPNIEPASVLLERIRKERELFNQSTKDKLLFSSEIDEQGLQISDIPESWETVRSKELFSFVTSGSRGWAKYYSEKGSIFIRMGNLNRQTIKLDLDSIQRVQLPEGIEGTRTKVKENDILISITADCGMIGLVPASFPEAYVNQHVALARPVNYICPQYLAWYLASSEGGVKQFRDLQRGATKVGLVLGDIQSLLIPLPSLQEQIKIVEMIDIVFNRIEYIESEYINLAKNLDTLNQSILSKAFKGELVEQDPNDEPASVLLERIQKEREKEKAKVKQTGAKKLKK
ncbi:restriction endonuclease subunit S [Phormidium tenue]|uniref:Restriction endonuclease subunit S n=1 Tax=Phormidium tenue FACHB-1050 TaxID=2692857 RepID=A0ABR8CCX7_9CYAN|nr:restriction endonuclease subunit S [Phormidium tenue]MBD2318171.1 restriction endonuclease subunit S [Phormidium tenue FACHB-1050]